VEPRRRRPRQGLQGITWFLPRRDLALVQSWRTCNPDSHATRSAFRQHRQRRGSRNGYEKTTVENNGTTANLGFEAKLWAVADALRRNMDATEYKHVVLGLIFLKSVSDAFEARHAELEARTAEGADPEDPDEYRAANIFWVPNEARWQHLKANAPQPIIGALVDDAMAAIERDNPSLKDMLPKEYARPGLDKQRVGQIINLTSDIALGSAADRARVTFGRVYEYFLARFASAEGKSGGQFYTPSHASRPIPCSRTRPSTPRELPLAEEHQTLRWRRYRNHRSSYG